jgi:branched-chain amino acid aminotransferase
MQKQLGLPLQGGHIPTNLRRKLMDKTYVYYKGQIVDENIVNPGIRNKAFNYGLGCFEGIRAYWNEEASQLYVFRLYDHYKRLLNSCKVLNINIQYTCQELCDLTVELLKKNNYKTTVYIRPLAYKSSNAISPTLLDNENGLAVYCQPFGRYASKEALDVSVTSWKRVNNNMIPGRTKATAAYLNSALAHLEVCQNGFDEAIFLTGEGNVCEGSGENIFMVRDGKLITPPPSDNILEGITRDTVIKIAKSDFGIDTVERSISRVELYGADELFFTGTAMEVTPIVSVDRRVIGSGKIGTITKMLKEQYMSLASGDCQKHIKYCTPVY